MEVFEQLAVVRSDLAQPTKEALHAASFDDESSLAVQHSGCFSGGSRRASEKTEERTQRVAPPGVGSMNGLAGEVHSVTFWKETIVDDVSCSAGEREESLRWEGVEGWSRHCRRGRSETST